MLKEHEMAGSSSMRRSCQCDCTGAGKAVGTTTTSWTSLEQESDNKTGKADFQVSLQQLRKH
jgi:hypothetical protein